MKVLHVITDLGQGGAEAVLYRLVSASSRDTEHIVVSLTADSHYGPRLRELGVEARALGGQKGRLGIGGLFRLRRLISEAQPDVVQTWMYHGDLVGGLAARSAGVRSVVWGIRNSNLDADMVSLTARAAARICARLSRWIPASIVSNSATAAEVHQDLGYRREIFTVIPNGYDLSRFRQDAGSGARLRDEWGIAPHQTLLGMVARWDPQKDHENLLRALGRLRNLGANLRCVLVGAGMSPRNATLSSKIRRLGLNDWIILAEARDDVPAVMNALDLHVLSSAGEAFPNAVAEAMACGTPCVVTDVGDAAFIVGDTGWVVPRQNPDALAHGITEALERVREVGRAALGRKCRDRIEANFTLETMVSAYRRLWARVGAEGTAS